MQFRSDPAADQIVRDILEYSGLYLGSGSLPTFEIVPTIDSMVRNNAVAVVCSDEQRYIFYDPAFIANLQSVGGKDWPRYFVFAHEIGHHLLNHYLNGRGDCQQLELDADGFAGFTLARMGAAINEALSGVDQIASVVASGCHPERCRRRVAVIKGFNKAAQQMNRQVYSIVNDCSPATSSPPRPSPAPSAPSAPPVHGTPPANSGITVGPAITTPKLPVVPSNWQTIASATYPRPATHTTLSLQGSGSQGSGTLEDSRLGRADGQWKLQGWQLTFSSAKICALAEIAGDVRTGLNIMTFQVTPLYCRSGRPCSCFGGDMVQSRDLTIYETLSQSGPGAPEPGPGAHNSPPAQYRPPTDVTGESWALTANGVDVRLDFHEGGEVQFSQPIWGGAGRWTPIGRQAVKIETLTHTIMGTLATSGDSMVANVYRAGSSNAEISGLVIRRIH